MCRIPVLAKVERVGLLVSSDAEKLGIADQQTIDEPTSGQKHMRQSEHDVPKVATGQDTQDISAGH